MPVTVDPPAVRGPPIDRAAPEQPIGELDGIECRDRVEQRFAKNAAAFEVRHGDGCRLEIFADIGHRSGSFLIQPAGTGANGEKLVWWRCSAMQRGVQRSDAAGGSASASRAI